MLIAVISDTHMPRGARRLPDECVRRIAEADLLLHAGDFSELEVLEELERIGPPLLGVCGNVDSPELRVRLPAERIVEAAGARDRAGARRRPAPGSAGAHAASLRATGPDAVVFGHSHLPLHERADDGFQIFNPGQPHRAAAGAGAHDGHGPRGRRDGSSFELIPFTAS